MTSVAEFSTRIPGTSTSVFAGRWIEVMSHIDPKYGGLSAAVPALGHHLNRVAGLKVSLAAFCLPRETFTPTGYDDRNVSFWPAERTAWLRDAFGVQTNSRFAEVVRQCDGVHIHGLWERSTAVASSSARKMGVPYVLSAHGMLEPWALRSSRTKKQIYSALIERPNIRGAACLHALTHSEAEQFVRFGARSPIAVIPNGVDIPERKDRSLFLNLYPQLRDKRLVLFLARLHRKKGLDLLVEAWSALERGFPDAHLVLAGPDFEGTQASVERLINARGLKDSVTFTGMLAEPLKWSALAAAESFVLPSYSEGLSVSVLEAMGMGLPVIVTDACNMPEVVEAHAGWEIQATTSALTDALRDLLAHSPEQNREIGTRGAQLVRDRYNWPDVAKKMAELYAWVRGGATPTSFALVQPQ